MLKKFFFFAFLFFFHLVSLLSFSAKPAQAFECTAELRNSPDGPVLDGVLAETRTDQLYLTVKSGGGFSTSSQYRVSAGFSGNSINASDANTINVGRLDEYEAIGEPHPRGIHDQNDISPIGVVLVGEGQVCSVEVEVIQGCIAKILTPLSELTPTSTSIRIDVDFAGTPLENYSVRFYRVNNELNKYSVSGADLDDGYDASIRSLPAGTDGYHIRIEDERTRQEICRTLDFNIGTVEEGGSIGCIDDPRKCEEYGPNYFCQAVAESDPVAFSCQPVADAQAQLRAAPGPCSQEVGIDQNCTLIKAAGISIRTDPGGFITTVLSVVLSLAGGIALLLIIISGYRFMVSQGNPEALQAAREQITSAIVGLLFIIFSLVILQTIGQGILKIPQFGG